jgi:hypothetical protein
MSNMVKAEYVDIKFSDNIISMTASNIIYNHNFKKTFTPENINSKDPFDFSIKSEVISKMPVVSDCRVSFYNKGLIYVEWTKDNMVFMATSGKVQKTESSNNNKF